MIQFKTIEPYFSRERDGLKCNTVMEIYSPDTRFDEIMDMIQTRNFGEIRILNPKTKEIFERQITDITYFDERFIISWKDKLKEGED